MKLILNEEVVYRFLEQNLKENPSLKDYSFIKIFSQLVYNRSLKYVPVDSGRLKNSIKIKFKKNSVYISYNTDYALYVHELVGNYHKPPTRSKYLENAFIDSYKELIVRYGKENVPKLKYKMVYSKKKVELEIYEEGVR